ncbi:DUF3500 domain-containing protein [Algoriphagus sp. D3-2-R+10]|uniref:DUF3500 domain-containing protein n=1 Tax=Algoriphagus aurantiacus TaxID=3103948 RepID=UPI002B37434C|nr:DUF3500 domain-containing protein [Algoriphagus sp. D3-2-R+10]MEB2775330.1 DUF3500 domain-containing protein [Algoriphagus sp. D3-2-R+10]
MKKFIVISLIIFTSLFLAFIFSQDRPATQFLNSLTQDQREKAQLSFDDVSKSSWHYIPSTMFSRAGLKLAELSINQKELFNELLQMSLSEMGFIKTRKIMDLENVLLEISGDSAMRDPEKYFIAFYGDPEKDSLWAWSFEGHHISLNFTVLNNVQSLAPRFLGASPATILSGPRKGERTLEKEEDLGFEMINSLSQEQQSVAIFQENLFNDIYTKNSPKVEPLVPVGIKFDELNPSQKNTFLSIIDMYLSTMPEELAEIRMENIKGEELGELRFGWISSTKLGQGHYYRIQGKSFLIEFDNTQSQANHIHTVWRDFDGDFGKDLIREHYKNSDHHDH